MMSDPRELLDAYAAQGEWSAEALATVTREEYAPEAIAALRAVLDACDREDHESIGIISTDDIRAAIAKEMNDVGQA